MKHREVSFEVGDKVLLSTKNIRLKIPGSQKLFPRWIGPFEVFKRVGVVAYKLKLPDTLQIANVFHVSLLNKYVAEGKYLPPPTILLGEELFYAVERVLMHRSAPAVPSGSGGVRSAGKAGRGVAGGSTPIASISTPAKDDVKAFNLEKFSEEDWASWSFRMEFLFNHYGLLEVMDGELKRPASKGATKEWDRRSKDGFFLLSQCLSSNQLHRGERRAMFMGADGRLVGLKRVLLVPGLCANLLSTKALSEAGMKMEMMGTKALKATLDGRVLWDLRGSKDMHWSMWEIPVLPWKEAAARLAAEAVRGGHASHVTSGGGGDGSDGGLLVHWGSVLPSVTPSTGEMDWFTAHPHFGHVALPQLQQLFKEERVKGLRIKGEPKELGSCETCLTSKFSQFPFHSAVGQSSDPVELVHVDLVGPMKVKGDGGAVYSMTMVDDYTRLTCSFPLLEKIHAARIIIEEWLPMVEQESGKRVKAIDSDRGGKFLGAEFRSWLKWHGIKQQLTTAYTPQSNGMAERANLHRRRENDIGGLGSTLAHWVPMENWSGKKPLVDMLRVFGCMGLVHVPKEKRDKLQAAAVWAVHLGLARGSKGWLMWDPKSNAVFTTRDAKFMEGLMFKEWLERGRSKVAIPLGIEVGTNDPLLIPIELSSSTELTEVSHDLGGAEGEAADVEEVLQQGEAPVAERGDTQEEVQQPIPSPKLPPRRTTQGKHDAVCGGAKVGAPKERPKRAAHPKDFLKYERLGVPKALLVQEKEDEEKGDEGEMEQDGIGLHVGVTCEDRCGGEVGEAQDKAYEEIYMKQPEGYDDGSRRVCKLNKAIYGLKQAPRCWYARLVEALEALGFKVSGCNESLFMTEGEEEKVFLLVYVHEILLFSPSLERIKEVQGKLKETFQCKALGPVGYYLGLDVEWDEVKGWLRLHQHKYLAAMGEKYGLEERRSVKTLLPSGFQINLDEEEGEVLEYELHRWFQSMVGSLIYASVNTGPDIVFSVSQLARVVFRPRQEHLDAAEKLVRYCMATSRVGLQYSVHGQLKQKGVEEVSTKTGAPARRGHLYLSCFIDATWASDISDATSHGSYICCVGGSPASWKCKKQGEIAHSSTESECMELFHGVKEVVWMRRLLEELGQEQEGPTPVFCDSQGAIAMARNAVIHGLNKHMLIKRHWVRKEVKKGTISLHYINTTKQPADFLTKRLAVHQHWSYATLCGMSFN
ncbi:unnamed protein product [Closterium sp. NIES-53]